MFKNMRLRTKIASGFGIVLVLTAIVGYVRYKGLSGVGEIVVKPDSANRLIELTQLARLEQKNHMAERDEKYEKLVAEKIDEITELAGELHGLMNDEADRQGVAAAQTAAVKYYGSFKAWVDGEVRQAKIYEEMVKAANEAIGLCEALRVDQKNQLNEARKSNAETVSDKLWKADSANRLAKICAAARLAQKNYMAEKDQKYADQVTAQVKSITQLCDALTVRMKQQNNRDQVNGTKSAVLAYHSSFQEWSDLEKMQEQEYKALVAAAEDFGATYDRLREVQKGKMVSTRASSNPMMIAGTVIAIILGTILARVMWNARRPGRWSSRRWSAWSSPTR